MKHRVRERRSPTSETNAWCETGGCQWAVSDGKMGSYRASRAARRHTERTGHTATLDRVYSIFYRAARDE
jgi:hypothetical protein